MKILVVEDSPSIRTVIRYIGENKGWDILEAADSASAIDLYNQANELDLVIVDHGSPNLSGLDVLKSLQNQGFHGKSIVLSLDTREEFIDQIRGLGISSWLHKPFSNEHFCTAIDHEMGHNLINKQSA